MGRRQDGLFAPRHVAPDRRRLYRKTKTFLGGSHARQPVARHVGSLRHRGSGHRSISRNTGGRAKEGRHSAALPQRQSAQHLIARGIDHRFGDAVSAVFNNLVVFDPAKVHESIETVAPDLRKAGPGTPPIPG